MAPLETAKTESPLVIDAHFTHVPGHRLFLVHIDADFECNGCNGPGHGPRYRCSACAAPHFFDLHEQCATCPSSLSSDFHHHPLILAVTRPGAAHRRPCALCGDDIDGLHYTCSYRQCRGCTFDIHPMCAALPMSVNNALHRQHLLTLQRCSSAGRCLACGGPCWDNWRYRCDPCGVDAHLECAFGMSRPEEAVPKAAVGHPAVYGGPAAYGTPTAYRAPAMGWCPQPTPQPQPMVVYYQNGCFYVAPPAEVPTMYSYTATACNNNCKYYYQLGQTQTAGNCNYCAYYYNQQQHQQLQQHQQQQQMYNCGGTTSSSTSSSNNKNNYSGLARICAIVGFTALRIAVGATTGIIF